MAGVASACATCATAFSSAQLQVSTCVDYLLRLHSNLTMVSLSVLQEHMTPSPAAADHRVKLATSSERGIVLKVTLSPLTALKPALAGR